MSKVVAIHQPNFFPWLGYFDKIIRSDIFIFLDDVQFQKTGGTWTNRVKLLVGGEGKWVTAAIDRNYHGTRTIAQMKYVSTDNWRVKALKTIQLNYQKHPFYRETIEVIEPLLIDGEEGVATYNVNAILSIARLLDIDVSKIRRSSELRCDGASNDLLCALTSTVGGDTYMCGGGADGYQDEHVFSAAGIRLIRQDFVHPVYPQHRRNDFVPGLSVIDAAMNLGWVELGRILRGG